MKSTRLTGFLIVTIYIAAILTLCMMNFSSVKAPFPNTIFGIPGDKAAHFLLFIPYAPLIYTYVYGNREHPKPHDSFSANRNSKHGKKTYALYTFFSGAAFGGVIEILQMLFTSSRNGEFMDWIADLCGLITGFALIPTFKKISDIFSKKADWFP